MRKAVGLQLRNPIIEKDNNINNDTCNSSSDIDNDMNNIGKYNKR